jgi:hypothetical protein
MNGEDRTPSIVGTLQHGLQFQAIELRHRVVEIDDQLIGHGRIGLGLEQFDQASGIVESALEVEEWRDPTLEALDLLDLLAGASRIGPEGGITLSAFEIEETRLLAVEVKGTPEARPAAPEVPAPVLSDPPSLPRMVTGPPAFPPGGGGERPSLHQSKIATRPDPVDWFSRRVSGLRQGSR